MCCNSFVCGEVVNGYAGTLSTSPVPHSFLVHVGQCRHQLSRWFVPEVTYELCHLLDLVGDSWYVSYNSVVALPSGPAALKQQQLWDTAVAAVHFSMVVVSCSITPGISVPGWFQPPLMGCCASLTRHGTQTAQTHWKSHFTVFMAFLALPFDCGYRGEEVICSKLANVTNSSDANCGPLSVTSSGTP